MTTTEVNAQTAFNKAFIQFQSEAPIVPHSRTVDAGKRGKYSYAELSAIVEKVRPVLARHGLGFCQLIEDAVLVTKVLHIDGGTLEAHTPLPNLAAMHPQEAGSAISYFRRYSLSALLGLVTDEDDDAQSVQRPPANGTLTQTLTASIKHEAEKANGIGNVPTRQQAAQMPSGTIRIGALKEMLREFCTDLAACEEPDQLTALLESKDTKRLLAAAEKYIPAWYDGSAGDGDMPSVPERISGKKAELECIQ